MGAHCEYYGACDASCTDECSGPISAECFSKPTSGIFSGADYYQACGSGCATCSAPFLDTSCSTCLVGYKSLVPVSASSDKLCFSVCPGTYAGTPVYIGTNCYQCTNSSCTCAERAPSVCSGCANTASLFIAETK